NDKIKPLHGENRTAVTHWNLANIGAPPRPSIMSTIMENAPSLLPSTIPTSTAKNVCNVIGTPPTTINGANDVIFAPIAVIATNTLAVVILSADQFVFS